LDYTLHLPIKIKEYICMSENEMITETRPVAGFDHVEMRDFGKLIIQQGEEESLKIEANANLMPKIVTEVKDEKLTLKIGRDWLERIIQNVWFIRHESVQYTVSMKSIQGLAITGSGSIVSGSIKTEAFDLIVSGHGDVVIDKLLTNNITVNIGGLANVKIAGETDAQAISVSGSGHYHADKMRSEQAKIHINGQGTVTVWCEETLNIDVSGMGEVAYFGNPQVRQRISGLGRVKSMGEPGIRNSR
jgi:hypothetical protein